MRGALIRRGIWASVLSIAGLSGCSGAGSTAASLPAAAGMTAPLALGLIPADGGTIAALTHIRHDLSYTPLPAAVDLSAWMPPVGNQGQEGSCVSWASAYALRGYEARRDVWAGIAAAATSPAYNFSPAFVYNQVNGGHDGGSTIPAALGVLQQKGAATLADMPYIAGQYTTAPSAGAFADAAHFRLASYGYVAPNDLTSMKAQLAAGLPVVLAIRVYNNFFTLRPNSVYTAPAGGYAGGHAVTAVGYDDSKQAIEIINSWGPGWGTGGYAWITYGALNQIALEAYSAIDDRGLPPAVHATPVPAKPIVTPRPAAPPPPKSAPTARPPIPPTPAPKASR